MWPYFRNIMNGSQWKERNSFLIANLKIMFVSWKDILRYFFIQESFSLSHDCWSIRLWKYVFTKTTKPIVTSEQRSVTEATNSVFAELQLSTCPWWNDFHRFESIFPCREGTRQTKLTATLVLLTTDQCYFWQLFLI